MDELIGIGRIKQVVLVNSVLMFADRGQMLVISVNGGRGNLSLMDCGVVIFRINLINYRQI